MIKLKKKLRLFFKTLSVTFFCCLVFVSGGYFYLNSQNTDKVNEEVSSVPYTYYPDNVGILFDVLDSKILFNLDFDDETVSVINAEELKSGETEIFGYVVDYRVKADSSLVAIIVDSVSGIDIIKDGETYAYTGVQVEELITTTVINEDLKKELISEILNRISKNGFSKEDFLCIIENSKTDLTLPDCYFWEDYIMEVCKTVRFVN